MLGPYYVTTDARRRAAYGPPCDQSTFSTVIIDGRAFTCHADVVDAYEAFDEIREHHGYRLTGFDTGLYSCRHMRHDPAKPMSFHSWAVPLDLNWLENPAGNKLVTDIPEAMRHDILQLQTVSGVWVFRWGADWDRDGEVEDHNYIDAMHWEPIAHPLDLATGIAPFTLSPSEGGTSMSLLNFDVGPPNAPAVVDPRSAALQKMLVDRGHDLGTFGRNGDGVDGEAGNITRAALADFQTARGITDEPQVVATYTYAALHAPGSDEPLDYVTPAWGFVQGVYRLVRRRLFRGFSHKPRNRR